MYEFSRCLFEKIIVFFNSILKLFVCNSYFSRYFLNTYSTCKIGDLVIVMYLQRNMINRIFKFPQALRLITLFLPKFRVCNRLLCSKLHSMQTVLNLFPSHNHCFHRRIYMEVSIILPCYMLRTLALDSKHRLRTK